MITEISINIKPENENDKALIERKCYMALFDRHIPCRDQKVEFEFLKKSIDARHGRIKTYMKFRAYIGEPKPAPLSEKKIEWKKCNGNKSVIIVGAGPAGLFAALKLLEYGIKPVIVDRGKETSERKRDIASISTKQIVDPDSNYCFGEGGAGTFSDGKLYTRSDKRGDMKKMLRIFHIFGADEKILTDSHPHIGTDRLPAIINGMKNKIRELGGEILFNEKCIDFILEESSKETSSENHTDPDKKITGIKIRNIQSGDEKNISADAVMLATGHSASDIYFLLARLCPESLEAKGFACGVRVEHPRVLIDSIQYHGKARGNVLPTAEYRITSQVDGRGVYSFCMCPGGFVVPSQTGPEEIVVNGMSSASRNSEWSNAAIVVETRVEDIPENFVKEAEQAGTKALAGLFFRRWLESEAYKHGDGQKAPAQKLTDFLNHKKTVSFPRTSYTPGIVSSRLDQWLPSQISERLAGGFKAFNRNMKGYISDDAVMIAVETRTSTPVRIRRDKETFESTAIKNLYPAGEGSGYSGGIVSSAMDGDNAAEIIAKKLLDL